MGERYFVQIQFPDGEIHLLVDDAEDIIERYGFRDCTDQELHVFRANKFGTVEPLRYIPADHAPFNYHKFVDTLGHVVFEGFSTEH